MSVYNLLPPADVSGKETLHTWWDNGFSSDELNKIISIGQEKIINDATVGFGDSSEVNPEVRRSRVGWLSYQDAPWLYDKLGYIARQINGQFFEFDLSGFHEDLQYTVYQSTNEGHYDWHMDKGYMNGCPPRKLSMVVMLSDPSEYEGGDLELQTSNKSLKLDKTRGIVHIFPSFVLHRVTPVTAGTRKSLVVWICGTKWR